MYKYNERLCSEMAGFFGDAALISSYKIFPKNSDYNSRNSAWGCAKPEASSFQELLLESSQTLGFLWTIQAKASWLLILQYTPGKQYQWFVEGKMNTRFNINLFSGGMDSNDECKQIKIWPMSQSIRLANLLQINWCFCNGLNYITKKVELI